MKLESIRCPRCCGSSWVCGRCIHCCDVSGGHVTGKVYVHFTSRKIIVCGLPDADRQRLYWQISVVRHRQAGLWSRSRRLGLETVSRRTNVSSRSRLGLELLRLVIVPVDKCLYKIPRTEWMYDSVAPANGFDNRLLAKWRHCHVVYFFFMFIAVLRLSLFVFFPSSFTNISVQYYYFVYAIGGQHDVHLPFWLPGFVKLITLLLHVLFACWNKYTPWGIKNCTILFLQ